MSLARWLLNQVRNPTGWLGRWNLRSMNRRHSKLTDWGLGHVSIDSEATILDIGCGGGSTVHKLAAIATRAKVYGVDYSETSVALSQKTNQEWIKTGRVEIRHASVSHLPFPDRMFALATAVETHFYWPDLPADMREVLRVLEPGGALVIIAEVYKGGKYDQRVQKFAELMQKTGFSYANLSVGEHRDLFSGAGFTDVQVIEEYEKGWICGIGKFADVGARRVRPGRGGSNPAGQSLAATLCPISRAFSAREVAIVPLPPAKSRFGPTGPMGPQ